MTKAIDTVLTFIHGLEISHDISLFSPLNSLFHLNKYGKIANFCPVNSVLLDKM